MAEVIEREGGAHTEQGEQREAREGGKRVLEEKEEVNGFKVLFSFPTYLVVPALTLIMVLSVVTSIINGSDFTYIVAVLGIATGVYAILHMVMSR